MAICKFSVENGSVYCDGERHYLVLPSVKGMFRKKKKFRVLKTPCNGEKCNGQQPVRMHDLFTEFVELMSTGTFRLNGKEPAPAKSARPRSRHHG